MSKDEAIHKALKVLNCLNNNRVYETAWVKGAINACEKALEQPAQEPVAWMSKMGSFTAIAETKKQLPKGTEPIPLYTHPHQWQELTDDEINELHHKWIMNSGNKDTQYDFARAIEAKLKEKNHGT
jgi:hypothetical protein